MTLLKTGPLVVNVLTSEKMTDFSHLKPDLRWVLTKGLDDSRLEPPGPNGKFRSPTWFQLEENGVWFAKGGFSHDQGKFSYWVGLWRKNETKPFLKYGSADKKGHRWTPELVTLSRDGKVAASADRYGEIHVWDTSTARRIALLPPAKHAELWNVAWKQDGAALDFGRIPNRGKQYERNRYGELNETFDLAHRVIEPLSNEAPVRRSRAATFDVQGERLIIGYNGRSYRFAENSFGEPTCYTLLRGAIDGVSHVAVVGSKSGKLVALELRGNGQVRVRRRFHGHHAMVTAVSQSPDGTLLASSSIDGTVRLWKLAELDTDLGDIDFDFRGNQVLNVTVGSESQRRGIRKGDRIMEFDGVSFYESRERMIQWKYRAGQSVTLTFERDKKYFSTSYALQSAPTHVEPLLSLLITKDDEWVLWSPRGYYDASYNGDRYIGWHVNRDRKRSAKFYKASQFKRELYRPFTIDRILELRDADRAIATIGQATDQVPAPIDHREDNTLQQLTPPVVKIVSPKDGHTSTTEQLMVLAEVQRQNEAPVTVRVEVNGLASVIKGARVEALSDASVETYRQRVLLKPQVNTITVTATAQRLESQPAEAQVKYVPAPAVSDVDDIAPRPDRPVLYVLAVGISDYLHDQVADLNYADLDATDFVKAWEGQNGLYGSIDAVHLTNDRATSGAIRDAMDALLNKKPRPEDLVVMLFSGHGVYDARGNYYLATHETDPDRLRGTAIPHTEISHLMTSDLAHCRRILFVDTCHSGAAVGVKSFRGDPWRDVGALVFASSVWREESLEHVDWKNGAFTEAFLEAMYVPSQGPDLAAPIIGDDLLSFKELDLYLTKRVASLTENRQHPTTKIPIKLPDFPIAQRMPAED